MTAGELIEELRKHDPASEVGIALEASHYVSRVDGVGTESDPVSAPAGVTLVVIRMSEESFVPADEA